MSQYAIAPLDNYSLVPYFVGTYYDAGQDMPGHQRTDIVYALIATYHPHAVRSPLFDTLTWHSILDRTFA